MLTRIQQFKDYLVNNYVERFSNTWLFGIETMIENYEFTQEQFKLDLLNKLQYYLWVEVIPKFQLISSWSIESYYTYFSMNNYSIKLTCTQNNEYNYIIIEDITINSKR